MIAYVVVVFVTGWLPPAVELSGFIVAPAIALIGVYVGMSPGYFFARQSIAAIDKSSPGQEVWSLSALPLNVDTVRKWAGPGAAKASLARPMFLAFGPDSMSVWIRHGMDLLEVLNVNREAVSLVRVIQNGTRPVINFGPVVDQANQMALTVTKGAFSFSPTYLAKGANFVTSWVGNKRRNPVVRSS
jgi:hypothetical protein